MTTESRDLLVKFTAALARRLARCQVRGAGFASSFVQAQGEALIDEIAIEVGITAVSDTPIEVPAPAAPAPEEENPTPPAHKPAVKKERMENRELVITKATLGDRWTNQYGDTITLDAELVPHAAHLYDIGYRPDRGPKSPKPRQRKSSK
jgi:hypothetical protein